MLRLTTTVLVRARAATGGVPPRALLVATLSTTVRGGGPERPPNDLPPASTVKGPGPDTISRAPPQARLTGDEVEEALDPLGRVGRAVEEAVKETVGSAAEVMSGKREDPIVNVAEEAFHSVPNFQRAREMQAARGKEKLAGSKYPDDIKERQMDPVGEAASGHDKGGDDAVGEQHSSLIDKVQAGMETVAEKLASAAVEGQHSAAGGGGGGGESLVGKATHAVETGAHVLKETVQGVAHKVGQVATAAQHSGVGEAIVETAKHAVEGVKGTVTGMAEKVSKTGAAYEEAMQVAAEAERKERAHGAKGLAEEVEEGAKRGGGGEDVENKDVGGGRREEGEEKKGRAGKGSNPSESVLGAPPGPKSEEDAGEQPWGRGNW